MTKSHNVEIELIAGDGAAAGFAQIRHRFWAKEGLFVPLRVAAAIKAEAEAKLDAELEAERAAEIKEHEERKTGLKGVTASAKAGSTDIKIGEHQPAPNEVARHRVLVDAEAVLALATRVKSGAVRSDRGDIQRETAALSAALARGPDRSVARPPQWRNLLDELVQELPAFRGPINLVSQSFALAERSGGLPALPPMLLLGPPGVGKSHFARRLAEVLDCGHAWLAFDQRSAGTSLRGADSHWANTRHGLLFEHLAVGGKGTANPVFVVDEIDKASVSYSSEGGTTSMVGQLLSLLEPETARRVEDISLHVELDASQIMWVATGNDVRRIDTPLLSRFEVFQIGMPTQLEQREACRRIVASVLGRLDPERSIRVSEGIYVILALYSPRVVRKAIERALGITVSSGRDRLSVEDVEKALGIGQPSDPSASQRVPAQLLH